MNSVTEVLGAARNEPSAAALLPDNITDPILFDWLLAAKGLDIDALPFGVVTMALDGTVEHYNLSESKLAGLTPGRVVGRHFFTAVAPCMNNFIVAHRYETEAGIDAVIDYVLTLRMAPKKVRMRMLKRPDARQMYLIIERRL